MSVKVIKADGDNAAMLSLVADYLAGEKIEPEDKLAFSAFVQKELVEELRAEVMYKAHVSCVNGTAEPIEQLLVAVNESFAMDRAVNYKVKHTFLLDAVTELILDDEFTDSLSEKFMALLEKASTECEELLTRLDKDE